MNLLIIPISLSLFDQIEELGFDLGLITNGYMLVEKPALINKLAVSANWVRFSLDAFSEKTFRKVHGRSKVSYNSLRCAIRELRARSIRPKIGIKVLISKINKRDAENTISEALKIGADYLQIKFLGEPACLSLSEPEVRSLTKTITSQNPRYWYECSAHRILTTI